MQWAANDLALMDEHGAWRRKVQTVDLRRMQRDAFDAKILLPRRGRIKNDFHNLLFPIVEYFPNKINIEWCDAWAKRTHQHIELDSRYASTDLHRCSTTKLFHVIHGVHYSHYEYCRFGEKYIN